jgi:hypothetical protein
MLIGAHSQALSLGEIAGIYGRKDLSKCCQFCGMHCEFWSEFNKVWQRREDILSQLVAFSGKRILSVSKIGKYRDHLAQSGLVIKVIRLIRDGRAVTASFLRKYPNRGYHDIVRQWVSWSQENDRWASEFPARNRMVMHYEDLLSSPKKWLREICKFLEISFESDMIKYWKSKHHIVDGNLGTLSFVRRYFGLQSNPFDRNFYAKQDPLSFSDERWRRELSPYHLYVFQKIGGELNGEYGYTPIVEPFNALFATRYAICRIRSQLQKLVF